jgi:prolyl-tRNA editing enzyme YbaK/EbsC (Cys-tRNA(Pro) deacylase)
MRHPLEQRVLDHLDALGASYEAVEIDPAFADTATFCETYGYAMEDSANAIVIASKRPPGQHCVCLGLATTRLDVNRRVKGLLGVSKLSFASAEQTIDLTGMEIGGVTPFGMTTGLPIYVDSAVMDVERAIVGGGTRAMKILLDPEVFARMDDVEVVEGLANPIG